MSFWNLFLFPQKEEKASYARVNQQMGSNHVVAVVEFAGGRIVVDVPSRVTAMASNVGLLKTTDNSLSWAGRKGGGETKRNNE